MRPHFFASRRRNHPGAATALAATALIGTLGALTACSSGTDSTAGSGDNDHLHIFATTGYLADAAHNLAPDAEITTMVGPGGDPHTYQPSTKDLESMKDAELVLWNGLNLEAQMVDQLESLGDKQLAVGDKVDQDELLPWPDAPDQHDPHIWNSPTLWSQAVDAIGDKLADMDPDDEVAYQDRSADYQQQIADAAADAEKDLSRVDTRVLVTGHDAFNYFGKTFNFTVHATDFVSTEATKSAPEISELADVIAKEKVPVIFKDNQANPQAVTSLKEAVKDRGWDVDVSDAELFADTLGPTPPTDTYLGAFRHNAEAVADGLATK